MTIVEVKPIAFQIVNEMQIVMGAAELGDFESSLRAVGRSYVLLERLREVVTKQALKKKPARIMIVKPN